MQILMVAAENNALTGAKAGGLGDVIEGICPELVKKGHTVTTIIPSYGFVHKENQSTRLASVKFTFRGFDHHAALFEATPKMPRERVRHLIIDHPMFYSPAVLTGSNRLYTHDPDNRPFATDANRFALFCRAVATGVIHGEIPQPTCLHLHDWHATFVLLLREFDPSFSLLKSIRTVFTIHNLALQGVRPLWGHESSLAAWYPGLGYNFDRIVDPTWSNCMNPLAVGIRLSDAVHTVSSAYSEEILNHCDKPDTYACGEGLESDLNLAKKENRLFGILNGCRYPSDRNPEILDFESLACLLKSVMLNWTAGKDILPTAHFLAYARLSELSRSLSGPPNIIATSVSRLTDQKMLMMKSSGASGKPGIIEILDLLESFNGIYILLGSGDPDYERFFTDISARFDNFVFLNGYSDICADALYTNGDLFLMPSSFEPCGLSQMLAMRDGQPCVAHRVGGLKDTVSHHVNGFVFAGKTLTEQVDGCIAAVRDALLMHENEPHRWEKICRNAAAEKFSWEKSAVDYIEKLYRSPTIPHK